MTEQHHSWSQAASYYEKEFINPYHSDVRGNPLKTLLRRLRDPAHKVAADLGCGIGPLLPFLSRHYKTVYAVDFAEGMLARARDRAQGCNNIHFVQTSLMQLQPLPEPVDVAVAVNSLVMPNPEDMDQALREIGRCLKPQGVFLGILPAIDAVHYYTMLLLDRARRTGMPLDMARKNAARHCEHESYDFAFGQFHYRGLEQHFWQPYEARYRFPRAGLHLSQLKKISLSWKQFAGWKELLAYPPPWDWFFLARRAAVEQRTNESLAQES